MLGHSEDHLLGHGRSPPAPLGAPRPPQGSHGRFRGGLDGHHRDRRGDGFDVRRGRRRGRWPQAARPTTNLLAAIVRGEPLRRVATLVTDQHTLELRRDGAACVRLTDELLRPLVERGHGAEMPSSRLLELELLEGGHESDLREITAHLRREGARPNPAAPLSFLPFCENTQPPEPAAPKLRRSASVRVLVAAAIGDGTLRLLRHDPRVRLSEDVEAVHQARVATRRLRSDLRTLAPLLDRAQVSRLRDELAWIGAQLGEVRDLDVLSARLRDQLGDLADPDEEGAPQPAGADELTAVLEREAAVRRAVLLDVLDSAALPAAHRRPRRGGGQPTTRPGWIPRRRRRTSSGASPAALGGVSSAASDTFRTTRPTARCTRSASGPSRCAMRPSWSRLWPASAPINLRRGSPTSRTSSASCRMRTWLPSGCAAPVGH